MREVCLYLTRQMTGKVKLMSGKDPTKLQNYVVWPQAQVLVKQAMEAIGLSLEYEKVIVRKKFRKMTFAEACEVVKKARELDGYDRLARLERQRRPKGCQRKG